MSLGVIALGRFSRVSNVRLKDTRLLVEDSEVLVDGCLLTQCDVAALCWDQIRNCMFVGPTVLPGGESWAGETLEHRSTNVLMPRRVKEPA